MVESAGALSLVDDAALIAMKSFDCVVVVANAAAKSWVSVPAPRHYQVPAFSSCVHAKIG